MRSLPVLILSGCLLATLIGDVRAAHPYHTSLAEVEWNPKTGNFEVALCVWPADLEKAISRIEQRPVDLDREPDVNALIQKYVATRFVVRGSDAQPCRMRWVGSKINLKQGWLFFEMIGDQKTKQWTIENQIFFEMNDDQLNQLQTKIGKSRQSVGLVAGKSKLKLQTSQ